MQTAISVNQVSFTYDHGRFALQDLCFSIPEGSSVGLIGANGAGKSTLLTLLCGLNFPERGEVLIDGVKVEKKSLKTIRSMLGVVFQNPDEQLFTTSVYNDIAFGPRNMGLTSNEVDVRVRETLEGLGIESLAEQPPYRLSDGEKRKAAIGAVLAMRPSTLLLDEPAATLDPRARKGLMRLLASLPQTKLIASHDLDMVLDICDKVILLNGGRVAAYGSSREILTNQELLEGNGLELPLSVAR